MPTSMLAPVPKAVTKPVPPAREGGDAELAAIVHSDDFERVHYALVLASAAAAVGRPAVLFFTGPAATALLPDDIERGIGWRTLSGAARDDAFATRGVATFAQLLEACRDLGVRMIVCEMALRARDIDAAALRGDLPLEVAGVVTLLGAVSPSGKLLFL
jgi:peroxiredoxin family protein